MKYRISIDIEKKEKDLLQKIADLNCRSVRAQVLHYLKQHLKHEEAKND